MPTLTFSLLPLLTPFSEEVITLVLIDSLGLCEYNIFSFVNCCTVTVPACVWTIVHLFCFYLSFYYLSRPFVNLIDFFFSVCMYVRLCYNYYLCLLQQHIGPYLLQD